MQRRMKMTLLPVANDAGGRVRDVRPGRKPQRHAAADGVGVRGQRWVLRSVDVDAVDEAARVAHHCSDAATLEQFRPPANRSKQL
jgi:hypothetical protein